MYRKGSKERLFVNTEVVFLTESEVSVRFFVTMLINNTVNTVTIPLNAELHHPPAHTLTSTNIDKCAHTVYAHSDSNTQPQGLTHKITPCPEGLSGRPPLSMTCNG